MNRQKRAELDQLFTRVGKCMLGWSKPKNRIERAALELAQGVPERQLCELQAALNHSPEARKMAVDFLRQEGIAERDIQRFF